MKLTNFIITCIFLITSVISAQTKTNSKMSSELFLAYGGHSSNEMPGFIVGASYNIPISDKWSFKFGLEGTLNDETDYALTFVNDGKTFDSTTHAVTGGIQLISGVSYGLINSQKSNFSISILPLLRYQATSISNLVSVDYPALTGLPYPVRLIINVDPYRTFSFGGSLRINYSYRFFENWSLGVIGGLQIDTNGDNLYFYGATVARHF